MSIMPDIYIKRDIEQQLIAWKNSERHAVAELSGARQTGKTTVLRHFGNDNYNSCIYINLASKNESLLFLRYIDEYNNGEITCLPDVFAKLTSSFSNDKNTLIIIDEVQENKDIYEMIRQFNRNLECDVVVTGSYLNKALNYFQPVGDVERFTLYPISFIEFVAFYGKDELLNTNVDAMADEDKCWMQRAYDNYIKVGGYPAVVVKYISTNSYDEVLKEQGKLIDVLRNEIKARVELSDFNKIDAVLKGVVSMLVREKKGNNKLVSELSEVTMQYNSFRVSTKECYEALEWLREAGFIYFIDKYDLVIHATFPSERIYFADCGMLTYYARLNNVTESDYTGIVNENFVCECLVSGNANSVPKYNFGFAVSDQYEIDFYLNSILDGCNYYIEVKNGNDTGASVNRVRKDEPYFIIYFRNNGANGVVDRTYTLPIWKASVFEYSLGGLRKVKLENL